MIFFFACGSLFVRGGESRDVTIVNYDAFFMITIVCAGQNAQEVDGALLNTNESAVLHGVFNITR